MENGEGNFCNFTLCMGLTLIHFWLISATWPNQWVPYDCSLHHYIGEGTLMEIPLACNLSKTCWYPIFLRDFALDKALLVPWHIDLEEEEDKWVVPSAFY